MWKIWLKHEHLQMIQNNERKGHCFFTLTILDYYNYISMVIHFSVFSTRPCSFAASTYCLKLERFKRNSLLRMFLWPIKDLYLGTCTCNLWHKVMWGGGRARKRNTNPSDICCGALAKSRGGCASSAAAPADCSQLAFDASVNNVGFPLSGWHCQIPN